MIEEGGPFKQVGGKRLRWFFWVAISITVVIAVAMLVPKAVAGYGKYVGQTPKEAVQKYFEDKYPEYASDDSPLLIEQYDEFTVVLYDLSVQHGQSPGEVVYYQLVRRNLAGWYINKSNIPGAFLGIAPYGRELESYIAWSIGWVNGLEYTLLCGKTLNDDVASVEVDFQPSGQTTRVDVKDGWFLILEETEDGEWNNSIRVLDAGGNVLGECDWSLREILELIIS